MDDIEYSPTIGLRPIPRPVLRIGDRVVVMGETGERIATAEVIETHDGGATLKTIPNGNGG